MKTVYIASPYSIGNKEENVRTSLIVAEEIIELGYIPFAPLLSHYWDTARPKTYDWWLAYDFEWLLRCDYLLRLPGESFGADRECEFAKEHCIPIIYSIDTLSKISAIKEMLDVE